MLVHLAGLDRIDNTTLQNFEERVRSLARRRMPTEPTLHLSVKSLRGDALDGELVIASDGVKARFQSTADTPFNVLKCLLADVMREFSPPGTDKIKA